MFRLVLNTSVITGTWAQTKCMAFRLCTELKRSLPRANRLNNTNTNTKPLWVCASTSHVFCGDNELFSPRTHRSKLSIPASATMCSCVFDRIFLYDCCCAPFMCVCLRWFARDSRNVGYRLQTYYDSNNNKKRRAYRQINGAGMVMSMSMSDTETSPWNTVHIQ